MEVGSSGNAPYQGGNSRHAHRDHSPKNRPSQSHPHRRGDSRPAGVTDVYSVSGRFDLLVILKSESLDTIESLITDHLLKVEGIVDSETMFAFRSYDKREGGRAIGVD